MERPRLRAALLPAGAAPQPMAPDQGEEAICLDHQLFVYIWFSLQDGAAQGRHRLAPPPPPRAPGRPELRRRLLVAQGQVGLRVPERCSLLLKWILLAKGTIHL